jgi:hypothetical protein
MVVVEHYPTTGVHMSKHISPLRQRMIEDMMIRNLSPTTQRSYIHFLKKFSQHFGRSPDRLSLEETHVYQVHLVSRGVAWATLNQNVSALRFFYGVTLGRQELPERIPYARRAKTVPVVARDASILPPLSLLPCRSDSLESISISLRSAAATRPITSFGTRSLWYHKLTAVGGSSCALRVNSRQRSNSVAFCNAANIQRAAKPD